MKDVKICQGTSDVEEEVETVLSEPPGRGEDGPESLQPAKKALDENSLGPEPWHVLLADNDRRDISPCPAIAEIGKKPAPIKQTVQLSSVVPQD